MAAKNFRVAIVGGGVCGVVCAIGLQRAGIHVDIFEAATKYGEVGAGIGIGPNAVRVLQKLDLLNDITFSEDEEPPAVRPFKYKFPPSDVGAVLFQTPAGEDDLSLAMHRASLLDTLVKSIDPALTSTHFNKRCTSITESSAAQSTATLHFSDGSTHETDVVIGADGVKSTVRNFVAGEEASKSLVFTNGIAYRGLVSMEKVEEAGVKIEEDVYAVWMGDGVHLVTYPIRNKTILNVAAFAIDYSTPMGHKPRPPGEPWVVPTSREEVLGHFKGWNCDVMKILESIEQPTKWYVHGLYPPLDSFVRGRVALIGDAAHAMLPFLAAGAGQGIEDAYVMSRLLAHPQTDASNLEEVLRAYDRFRAPRANDISLRSKRCGDTYEGYGPSGPSARGREADMKGMWEAVWYHDLEADVEAAFGWLRDEGIWS
ncbi:FAD/NAD(P)-binding domain-containing protein [Dentipellis sp. KUC8613]|nr:FAD/NAD(P)-binding domain-containing protein [Dentipellis sp. KUC8613]